MPKRESAVSECTADILVFEHEDCLGHDTCSGGQEHQEAPERLVAIRERLAAMPGVSFCSDFELASDAALRRVHSKKYLDTLLEVERAFAHGELRHPEPLSPHVVSRLFPSSPMTGMTIVSAGSVRAARRAAGAVIAAIDKVLQSEEGAAPLCAFCLVRPPGHHSMINGFDPVAGGCGFCLMNSVCVGAAHALSVRGRRVAIVDFDVHMGNGTEDIVSHRLALAIRGDECHEPSPGDGSGGSGGSGGGGGGSGGSGGSGGGSGSGSVNSSGGSGGSSSSPSVLFCSTHLYEHFPEDPNLDFFPGRGGPTATQPSAPASSAVQAGSSAVLNLPIEPLWVRTQQPRGRVAFRAAVSEKLLPRLMAFAPDLLLLSAGFDGAAGDEGNAQDEVGGLDLSSDDFRWVTARLCAAVGPLCPIVSVLEGGYGAWDHDESAYDRSCLVQGCAAHVQALVAHARSMRRTSKRAK